MASDPSFVEFIADQMKEVGSITFRKMFGEYALYCDGNVVALICDGRLFIKPRDAGREFLGDVVEERHILEQSRVFSLRINLKTGNGLVI